MSKHAWEKRDQDALKKIRPSAPHPMQWSGKLTDEGKPEGWVRLTPEQAARYLSREPRENRQRLRARWQHAKRLEQREKTIGLVRKARADRKAGALTWPDRRSVFVGLPVEDTKRAEARRIERNKRKAARRAA